MTLTRVAPPAVADTQKKAASKADARAAFLALKPGSPIEVENGRVEIVYRGKLLEVQGTKVRVQLPAADKRPFTFDLADPMINVEGNCLYTGW